MGREQTDAIQQGESGTLRGLPGVAGSKVDLKQRVLGALERLSASPGVVAGFFRHLQCCYMLDADAAA